MCRGRDYRRRSGRAGAGRLRGSVGVGVPGIGATAGIGVEQVVRSRRLRASVLLPVATFPVMVLLSESTSMPLAALPLTVLYVTWVVLPVRNSRIPDPGRLRSLAPP